MMVYSSDHILFLIMEVSVFGLYYDDILLNLIEMVD